jgi:uncharacterized protein (TIGR03435 family)
MKRHSFRRSLSEVLITALPVILAHAHVVKAQNIPAFEVASIKPGQPGLDLVRMQYTPVGFVAENVPVQVLIREAYSIREDQILALPDWAKTQNYNVNAKVNPVDMDGLRELSLDQRRAMLIPLLADRFKLIVHKENKSLPVYALVVAKSGPKFKEAKAPDILGAPPQRRMVMGFGQISGQGIPIASLVEAISGQNLGRKIVDKTGLAGDYDIELKWSPEATQGQTFTSIEDHVQAAAPPPDTGSSIFTALQEQLGLKLEPEKGQVEIIVVDQLERPSPN